MKAKTHAGDERRSESSSSQDTMTVEEGRRKDYDARAKADENLSQSGLNVNDVARQSSYEDNQADVTEQAANSDRNRR
jgi:hypothetical protein